MAVGEGLRGPWESETDFTILLTYSMTGLFLFPEVNTCEVPPKPKAIESTKRNVDAIL